MKKDDKSIWARIRQSDNLALKMLFDSYYRPLCAYALQFLKRQPDAEDLVQGTFITLWTKRSELNIETSLKAYLYKSVFNACVQHVRKDKKIEGSLKLLKWKMLQDQIEEDHTMHLEKIEKIRNLVDALPDRCKEIVLLSKQEGYKNREIAEKLGISVKTVESQMRIAFNKIREEYGKNGEILLTICFSHPRTP